MPLLSLWLLIISLNVTVAGKQNYVKISAVLFPRDFIKKYHLPCPVLQVCIQVNQIFLDLKMKCITNDVHWILCFFFRQGWSNPQTNLRELETQLSCPLLLQTLAKVLDQESTERPTQIIPFHPNINRNVQGILSTNTVFHPSCPYWIFLKSSF